MTTRRNPFRGVIRKVRRPNISRLGEVERDILIKQWRTGPVLIEGEIKSKSTKSLIRRGYLTKVAGGRVLRLTLKGAEAVRDIRHERM
jgi:hypothetical protein